MALARGGGALATGGAGGGAGTTTVGKSMLPLPGAGVGVCAAAGSPIMNATTLAAMLAIGFAAAAPFCETAAIIGNRATDAAPHFRDKRAAGLIIHSFDGLDHN